jgi:hypothetical protein
MHLLGLVPIRQQQKPFEYGARNDCRASGKSKHFTPQGRTNAIDIYPARLKMTEASAVHKSWIVLLWIFQGTNFDG